LKNKVGIVQGRLTAAPKARLQFFPKNWRNEFAIAQSSKIDFIEFFSERIINKKNPIWNDKDLNEYIKLAKKNKLKILNFCDDHIIQNSILKKTTIKYLKILIKQCGKLKIKNIIFPMYSKSELTNLNWKKYIKVFKLLGNFANRFNISILIESDISSKYFKNLKNKIKIKNFYFLFDTGNRVITQSNIYQDIIEFNKDIKHIHIKDKNKNKKNVILGEGMVDFELIFKKLKKIKFKGNFTIESVRGKKPEITAKKNVIKLKKLINKNLI